MHIDNQELLSIRNLPEKPIAPDETELRASKIKEQSKELEKLFVTYLVKALERTIPEGIFNSSQSNLTSMLFSSVMADAIVERGGFGLSEMIAQSLSEKDAQVSQCHQQPVLDVFDVLRNNLETGSDQ